jgi:hypothetical protein
MVVAPMSEVIGRFSLRNNKCDFLNLLFKKASQTENDVTDLFLDSDFVYGLTKVFAYLLPLKCYLSAKICLEFRHSGQKKGVSMILDPLMKFDERETLKGFSLA